MKTKKLKLFTIALLLLPLCVVLLGAGCEGENPSIKQNTNGSWKVSKQNISDELESIIAPPDNAIYTDISIMIPDTIEGNIRGHTFRNTFGVQFKIKNEEQINFKNFLATRFLEDDWGRSFQENLLNTVKFSISNDELFFIDSQNQTVIVFIKN